MQAVQPPKKSIIQKMDEGDSWEEAVLTWVLQLLNDESDGRICMSTPAGRECNVFVVFREAGSA